MWSEHCSYKSSRVHLKRLPTKSDRVVQGPGENAGIIDVGDGWACAFKIESHNHPSYIEPYQGAATGVGGILRDIFTMGARPLAVMDSLRFGPISKHGCPTFGAELGGDFAAKLEADREIIHKNHPSSKAWSAASPATATALACPTSAAKPNSSPATAAIRWSTPSLSASSAKTKSSTPRPRGTGNPVIYVGAKTGRDGIHGATMASEEFKEGSEQKRPNVQVGDPFMEKLLLEACLEAMQTGAIVGIQDMGAAGLTCSTCEMGARGGVGLDVELDLVPQRETGMSAYEIMLSESQERMLLVAEKGREDEVLRVFAKWGLDAVIVGTVQPEPRLRIRHHGELVADIPNQSLTDDAPLYHRPVGTWKAPVPLDPPAKFSPSWPKTATTPPTSRNFSPAPTSAPSAGSTSSTTPWCRPTPCTGPAAKPASCASKAQASRIRNQKSHERGLAMALDGNGRWCYLDPKLGAMHAVAEAARKVACTGATPVAATNCLNFGNPEKPEIMAQLSAAIDGIAEACTALGTPITGGNVSLYNETRGEGIYPTPVLGIVGILDDVTKRCPRALPARKRRHRSALAHSARRGARSQSQSSAQSSAHQPISPPRARARTPRARAARRN